MLPVCVLQVLETYSDIAHPLTQQRLIKILEEQHQLSIGRKALGNVLAELQDCGYDISYRQGYYLDERQFTKSELSFLIDSVLADTTMTQSQAKQLLEKLLAKESAYTKRSFYHVHNVSYLPHGDNPEFFLSIELINEAIEQNRKIRFDYYCYGLDLRLHKRKDHPYIVSPYDMMVSNGHYYLAGNTDAYDNISHYRIDKIRHVAILKEPRKDIHTLPEGRNGLSLPTHMMEHIYMFSGPSEHVVLLFKNQIIDQIVDWFGKTIRIEPKDAKTSYLYVKVNRNALHYWLKQYDEFVKEVKVKDHG